MNEPVTVAFVPAALDAIRNTITRTGLSRTDVINRAVQLYEFAEEQLAAGGQLLVRDADGRVNEVHLQ